ncbi:MAG: ParM/StbA family protein [Kiritimatiellae bacterium]|nr:ParM/StbA family protein [Kiritimatiellia bacterium]
MSITEVVSLDIGHSAVKAAFANKDGVRQTFLFPAVVSSAVVISDETEARRAALETVRVGNRDYFVGHTALIQAAQTATTGLSENWIETPEHTALLVGGLQKIRAAAGLDNAKMLVLGLPAKMFTRQRNRLKEIAAAAVGPEMDIRVIPQPIGAYYLNILDTNGTPARSLSAESWGIVEIGHYTTDFALIRNGRWAENGSGSCNGVRVAAEHLVRILADTRKITIDLFEAEEALRTREIRVWGKGEDVSEEVQHAVEYLVSEVVDNAVRLMEGIVSRLNGVIVAGGGANLVYAALREKWPHAVMIETPRFAVVEGMRRYGLSVRYAASVMGR